MVRATTALAVRNRMFAIVLASVAVPVFGAVVAVTVLILDAEVSHGLWNL
jgi:hypothetical protein